MIGRAILQLLLWPLMLLITIWAAVLYAGPGWKVWLWRAVTGT